MQADTVEIKAPGFMRWLHNHAANPSNRASCPADWFADIRPSAAPAALFFSLRIRRRSTPERSTHLQIESTRHLISGAELHAPTGPLPNTETRYNLI